MMHGYVTTKIGGAHYALRITLGPYFAIEERSEGGVRGLSERLAASTYTIAELRNAFVTGLVGGGMALGEAHASFARLRLTDMQAVATACGMALEACADGMDASGKGGNNGDPLTMADVYSSCFMIGIKPWEADRLTLFQWTRCVEGFNTMNGGEETIAPPDEDHIAKLLEQYG